MDSTAAWANVLRVHAALTPLLDRELRAAHGLPLMWYDVLLELHATPGGELTMTDLGAVTVLSRSRVSRVVDELAAAGLVERSGNPADRRSSLARLTPAGRERVETAAPTYRAGIERHFTGRMTKTEAATVATALGKVLRAHEATVIIPLG